MNTSIFIKTLNDIDVEEQKRIYLLLNDEQKIKVNRDNNKLVEYYLLDYYIRNNNLNSSISEIKYSVNGKPYLNNINFSIANKDNITVLGISYSEIGVDIEKVTNYSDIVLNYFFTDDERNGTENNYDFFKVYTLKEAYVKMLDLSLMDIKLDKYKYYYNFTINYNDYVISYIINKKIEKN